MAGETYLQKKAHAVNLMKKVDFFVKKARVLHMMKEAGYQDNDWDSYENSLERYGNGGDVDYGAAFVKNVSQNNLANTMRPVGKATKYIFGDSKNNTPGVLAGALAKYNNGTWGVYGKTDIKNNFLGSDGKWMDPDKVTESYNKLVGRYPGLDKDPTWGIVEAWHTSNEKDVNYRVRKMTDAINKYNQEHPEKMIDAQREFVPAGIN